MKRKWKWMLAVTVLACVAVKAAGIVSEMRHFFDEGTDDGGVVISVIEEETESEKETKDIEETEQNQSQWVWEETEQTASEADYEEENDQMADSDERAAGRRSGWSYQVPSPLPTDILPEEETLPTIWLISDLHYMSAAATDYGSAFEEFVRKSDGKLVRYLPEILDSVLEEAVTERPDALILTGDITMDGEKINHLELAEKLTRVQESGIQVLVIPGNHDINNLSASVYFGETAESALRISPGEYEEIYGDLGPGQALSRDAASFSYVYALRDKIWLVLLDTARYDPVNLVEGEVRPETCAWLEENLEAAQEQGIQVLVLGHHNLLQESRMYTTMCVMDNGQEVVELLERYHVPLYISGHLHLQRVKKHKREPGATGYGIHEIVSDAFSIPPCQYGAVSWQEDGTVNYETRSTDVSSWAAKKGMENEELLNFEAYQKSYVHELIKEQVKKKIDDIPEETADSMGLYYAELYADYCAGLRIDQAEAEYEKGYGEWERFMPDSREMDEIRAMIRDSVEDSNRFIFSQEREDEEPS